MHRGIENGLALLMGTPDVLEEGGSGDGIATCRSQTF